MVADAVTQAITINRDGTHTPPGGVKINAGGEVRFIVNFPPGKNTCYIPFGDVRFEQEGRPGGTVKVGS